MRNAATRELGFAWRGWTSLPDSVVGTVALERM